MTSRSWSTLNYLQLSPATAAASLGVPVAPLAGRAVLRVSPSEAAGDPSFLWCFGRPSRLASFLDTLADACTSHAQVVTGAMGTLLPKLASLLTEEYRLHKNLRGEIVFLKAELESMEAALLKVTEAPIDQPPDNQVKLWARDVKELSYDIEDSIDKFMARIETRAPNKLHSFRGFIDTSLNLLAMAKILHKIGTDIKEIKIHIKNVSERRDRYKVDGVAVKPIGTSTDDLRQHTLLKKVTELVGTDEARDDIISKLMEGDETSQKGQKIINIVGFGGLGKTTVANVVYQKLKSQCDCGAFVSVSVNPSMDKIFKNMLRQFDEEKFGGIMEQTWDIVQLIGILTEFLRDKSFFVVIDDIWDNSTWETIKYALVENHFGSRVITTTRILDVAKHIGGVYQLKPLSHINSRKLFFQRIFGSEHKYPPNHLAGISENILKKCDGIPLAIMTVASMLADKKNENMQMCWSMVYQSMGSGLEDSLHVKNMRRILSVSYYDLPPYLRTCLLYLCLYPEGYEIYSEDLIWKWVGEGFVHEEPGKSLHEVGKDYCTELINKSLIQPVRFDTDSDDNDKLGCFHVHDMVHDFITWLSNEEHFLTILGGQQPMSVPSKIHRLSIQISKEEDFKQLSTMNLSHVRSLYVSNQAFSLLPALSSFPVLRVLDLRNCKQVDNHHFKLICNLFHLRYLCLQGTSSITEIPKQIRNLQLLRVLNIRSTNIRELPPTFIHLQQLMYLYADFYSEFKIPDEFGNLKSLEKIVGIITVESPATLGDLGNLTKWDNSYKEPFLMCVFNLVNLEILGFMGCHGDLNYSQCDNLNLSTGRLRLSQIWMVDNNPIDIVPKWFSSLSFLCYLKINVSTLSVKDLEVLGSIPSLDDLYIVLEETTESRDKRLLISDGYPFRRLTSLKLESKAMEVAFAEGAMRRLQAIYLEFEAQPTKDRFGDFVFGLENLSSLKRATVRVVWCSDDKPGVADGAVAAIQEAIDKNPNKPTLGLKRTEWW